ncbi:uncharacterized protein [Argopecten irradians]|uniref:uncharacterized protein n=1 Tax=Argopecten irradians TaxID=31199 RepID=UPI00371AE2A5
MESVLFWVTIASCFACVQMAVWEPLLILNVTDKTSVSPLDIWNDQELRQPPQDITTEDWIRDGNKPPPFVSDRISHWDIVRPEMIEVQAVNFKQNDVQIVQSILFNTTTSNSSSFDDWMKVEYLSNQNRMTEVIETPAQLQPQNALVRYNYASNGTSGNLTVGGMTFLLDTQNVSERGSLLLTSDARNIGDIGDILFNLNTHTYKSSSDLFGVVFDSNNHERISSTNHKIVCKDYMTTDNKTLLRLRCEIGGGVVVKTLLISGGPYVISMTLDDGSQSSEVVWIRRFHKEYNKRILNVVITPATPVIVFIYDIELIFAYTYLPYDVADYFVIRGRFGKSEPILSNII